MAQNLEIWIDYHWVNMMVQSWVSTDGTSDGEFEVLLLGASLGSLDVLAVG